MGSRLVKLLLVGVVMAGCGGSGPATATACHGDSCFSSVGLREVELYDGIRRGVLRASARGVSMSRSELLVTAKLDLILRIDSGTQFGTPPKAEYQGMVVAQTARIQLRAGVRTVVRLPTACTHFSRRVPRQEDTFEIVTPPALLAKLMRCMERSELSRAAKQTAVWLVTDSVDESALGARPEMLMPMLVERCIEKKPSMKEQCPALVKDGLSLAYSALLKRARPVVERCGIPPEQFGINRVEQPLR